jgi:hypothetical protein
MSEKNAEVVRRGIDAFNRGEVEELLLYANPEIELNVTIDAAERNVYRGHEGVRTWFADTFATFEDRAMRVTFSRCSHRSGPALRPDSRAKVGWRNHPPRSSSSSLLIPQKGVRRRSYA